MSNTLSIDPGEWRVKVPAKVQIARMKFLALVDALSEQSGELYSKSPLVLVSVNTSFGADPWGRDDAVHVNVRSYDNLFSPIKATKILTDASSVPLRKKDFEPFVKRMKAELIQFFEKYRDVFSTCSVEQIEAEKIALLDLGERAS